MNIHEKLRMLQETADAAISALIASPPAEIKNEAINWADLSCEEARFVTSTCGGEYYELIVTEASPDAYNLRQYIRNAVRASFTDDIYVVAEW